MDQMRISGTEKFKHFYFANVSNYQWTTTKTEDANFCMDYGEGKLNLLIREFKALRNIGTNEETNKTITIQFS